MTLAGALALALVLAPLVAALACLLVRDPRVAEALNLIASAVSLSDVQQVVLQAPYTQATTIGAQDVLLPNWYLILPEVHKYFPPA